MKKIFLLYAVLFGLLFSSCSNMSSRRNGISQFEAINAIKEALSLGTKYGGTLLSSKNAFSKETLLSAILPEEFVKFTSVLSTLGLSSELDRFTGTLGTAAAQTAEKSVPIFLSGIGNMKIKDGFKLISNGGTSATDYLRLSIGDTLRRSITPIMNNALATYNLDTQWKKLIQPAQLFLGNKLNLDLGNFMAGLVANAMFNKIEQKEVQIRTDASARTSGLLQKVFGRGG